MSYERCVSKFHDLKNSTNIKRVLQPDGIHKSDKHNIDLPKQKQLSLERKTKGESRNGHKSSDRNPYNKMCKVYVDHFPSEFSNDQLAKMFSPYGEIETWHIEPDRTEGSDISFGFVIFKKEQSAASAIAALKGHVEGSHKIYVGNTTKFRRGKGGRTGRKSKNSAKMRRSGNLEVRGLPPGFTDIQLKNLVSSFGHIRAAKMELANDGTNEMVGVVRLGNGDIAEATKSALDGKTPAGLQNPVSVSFTVQPKKTLQTSQQSRRSKSTRPSFIPRRHKVNGSVWHDYYTSNGSEHQPTWKDRWKHSTSDGMWEGRYLSGGIINNTPATSENQSSSIQGLNNVGCEKKTKGGQFRVPKEEETVGGGKFGGEVENREDSVNLDQIGDMQIGNKYIQHVNKKGSINYATTAIWKEKTKESNARVNTAQFTQALGKNNTLRKNSRVNQKQPINGSLPGWTPWKSIY